MPFIMGEIRGFEGKKPLRAKINEHMHALAAANAQVTAVKLQDVVWQSPTNVHFSKEGGQVAGKRMVKAWKELAKVPK